MQQNQPFQATTTQSQYRGVQNRYQPVGFVQSYYQRPEPTGYSTAGVGSQIAGTASYQLPNYQGNQPGHDQYLRSDSSGPTGFVGQSAQNQSYGSVYTGAIQPTGAIGQSAGYVPTVGTGYQATPQSYQTANYRGNQPGHDQYLRSDSNQPSFQNQTGQLTNFQGQIVQSQFGQPQFQSQYGTGTNLSYQTSNYRGNQPGHDQYLRSDSSQPTGFR